MRFDRFGFCLIAGVAFGLVAASAAPAYAGQSRSTGVAGHRTAFGTAPARHGAGARHVPQHLTALVGDRHSGLGFYPLPGRYRVSHAPDRRGDAIGFAIASEAGYGTYYGIGGESGYGGTHHHALFNPVDGYGSPFFAGYYGSARDDDSEPGPLGGTAYAN